MVFRTVDVVRQAFIKAYIESSKEAEDIFFSHLNALYTWMQEKHGNDEALAMAFKIKGNDAKVAVIPDGLGVVVNI